MTIHAQKTDKSIILNTTKGDVLGINDCHFEPEFLHKQKLITHTAQGRGTVYFFNLGNTQLALRHYKRGGMVAKLNDDKFIFTAIENSRCYKEISVLQVLRDAQVNVPEPIAGRVVKSGFFYTADIITKVITEAVELHELLQKELVASDIWQNIGIEIKKMHQAQLCHYDLNVKNILLSNKESANAVHLLDFDKCELRNGHNWKMKNLERLQRSLNKQSEAQINYYFNENDWKTLMAGYCDSGQSSVVPNHLF